MNFRRVDAATLGVSLDETTTREDVERVLARVRRRRPADARSRISMPGVDDALPAALARTTPVPHAPGVPPHRSETEMLRYLRRLADRDLALDRAMIPLGSCTMKLNATSEMIPVTWPRVRRPASVRARRTRPPGYRELVRELERDAVRVHRLRRGVAAAERGLAGRVRGPARDRGVSRERAARRIATSA